MKSEVYQIEDENTEEDQSTENLDAKSDLEEMSDKDTPIELGNKSLVAVLSQEYLSMDVPHIDFIFGGKWWIFKGCDLMVNIHRLKHPMV